MRPVLAPLLLLGAFGCAGSDPTFEVEPGEADEVLDGKADGADDPGAEVKVTVDGAAIARARSRMSLRNASSQRRDIWFYDTPSLALFDGGAVLRARDIRGEPDDSTVKLRPFAGADPSWFALDGFKCEIDRTVDRETPSCSLTVAQDDDEIDDVADGDRAIDKLFSDEQETFLADNGPGFDWDELAPLGPIPARVWKLRSDALPARLTAELWVLADATEVLELSMKVPADQADDALDALLDLLDDLDLALDDAQESKTRRALELLAGG